MTNSVNLWEILASASDDKLLGFRTKPVWENGHVGEWINMQELSLTVADDYWAINVHGCGEDVDNSKHVSLRVYSDGRVVVTRTKNDENTEVRIG